MYQQPPAAALCHSRYTLQGAHYYYEGVKLAQGRDNVLRHLKENPDTAARITTAVQAKMRDWTSSSKQPAAAKDLSSSLDEDEFGDDLLDDEALLKELEQHAGRTE